ncbi:MAG: spermidine/putrescine ABC transporter substrate-binding protein [Actinomycetota bacterium]
MKRTRHLGRQPIGRREFLLGLGAVGLSACATTGQNRDVDLGGRSRVWILNWEDYIDVGDDGSIDYPGGTIRNIADQLGVQVGYDPLYTDNYDGFEIVLREAVNAEVPSYDIVIPTNWRAAQMIANGWAEPLPIEVIPNHANIDPAFLTNAWDRGCRFQMPWQAGITGIAYNPELTGRELTSVNDLFDPAFAGRVGFIGEMREAVGLAMLANGDDPSRPTRATAEAGLVRIEEAAASGQVGAFTFNEFADLLRSGDLALAMAWSGDAASLQADRPDIQFLVPDEGAIQWFDTMVIPTGSPNLAAAGAFMNFVYDPANAATITEWVQYISPVLGVQEVLASAGGAAAELASSPVLFPDAPTRARLFTWGGLDQADEDELDGRFAALLP